jgi:hypothetical protein
MSRQISHLPARRRHGAGATVELDVGTFDRVIDDLVALGLVLVGWAEADQQIGRERVVAAASGVDQIIARLQDPARPHPGPNSGGADSPHPDLLATQMRQTLARAAEFAHGSRAGAPCTIEMLDAAHSAQRALVALGQSETRL